MTPETTLRPRRRSIWMLVALAIVLNAGACDRAEPVAAAPASKNAPLLFPFSLSDAAPKWNQAYQRALRDRLATLAQRDDAISQLDIVRLQPLLDGYYTAPPTGVHQERERALRRAQALAAPGDDTPFWYEAAICAHAEPMPGTQCDPNPALAHLQRSDADNAAVWLMSADTAAARGDQARIDTALLHAAKARRYDIRYGRNATETMRALGELELPALDEPARAVLNSDGLLADANLHDARMALAGGAFPLPSPLAFQRRCRTAAAAPAGTDAELHAACTAIATRMADSDTLIGQMFGLTVMAQLSARSADGAAWRERLRTHYWQSAHLQQRPNLIRDLPRVWRVGEVATFAERLKAAGLDRPPPDWLPESPLPRSLVLTGRYIDPPPAAQP
ncbi:hypothetical protein [Lysobacter gummosus]|uniref:Lipoprotein n=1 Tax=Lysobacter gummosus TaxID=262324 RepID=A0ABY3XBA0_9GAMM|nr:hypothetical protein [Lysobacter gummosus]UNP29839.1 hypothetical protein MOV92_00690 [Lysobacter gummosus]